ncbi:MAG: 5,10-methylenetetrahydrofolate reductase [Verrucomicrobiales bacterium]|nr:5,10-methylenetetrahydrofolate reductase [Verrucomicrobiales bacterium]
MKVTDHLAGGTDRTLVSFEILPPLKGKGVKSLWEHLDPLMEYKPSFINVTYHRSESTFKRKTDGTFEKVQVRKRPGTVGICAALQNRYAVDAVAHLICGGFTKEETEDALIDLHFLGIDNVLVLRGDAPRNEAIFEAQPGGHSYAIDLLEQVMRMNQGLYLEEDLKNAVKTDFCVGVAGYPEKHFEAPNLATDLSFLKTKVDSGACYVTTQMFFNNKKYFEYVDACRAAGITVPIIPGLKPLTTKKQLTIIPRTFHVDIPEELSKPSLPAKQTPMWSR